MDYVNVTSNLLARQMEVKLQELPASVGIIFVSVDPIPAPEGSCTDFVVTLGLSRTFEQGLGAILVNQVLKDEKSKGLEISTKVFRGVPGACRNLHNEAARQVAPKAESAGS